MFLIDTLFGCPLFAYQDAPRRRPRDTRRTSKGARPCMLRLLAYCVYECERARFRLQGFPCLPGSAASAHPKASTCCKSVLWVGVFSLLLSPPVCAPAHTRIHAAANTTTPHDAVVHAPSRIQLSSDPAAQAHNYVGNMGPAAKATSPPGQWACRLFLSSLSGSHCHSVRLILLSLPQHTAPARGWKSQMSRSTVRDLPRWVMSPGQSNPVNTWGGNLADLAVCPHSAARHCALAGCRRRDLALCSSGAVRRCAPLRRACTVRDFSPVHVCPSTIIHFLGVHRLRLAVWHPIYFLPSDWLHTPACLFWLSHCGPSASRRGIQG